MPPLVASLWIRDTGSGHSQPMIDDADSALHFFRILPSASFARPFVTCGQGPWAGASDRGKGPGLHFLAVGIFGLLAPTVLLDDVQNLHLAGNCKICKSATA